MSHMHEELEVGGELDQALRAMVTGLGQLSERIARRAADRARQQAAAERDEARQSERELRDVNAAARDKVRQDQFERRDAERRAEMAQRDRANEERRAVLDQRNAARQAYGPWTREGAIERGNRVDASRAWERAAAWAGQDPTAADAEKMLREGIIAAHGVSPAEILRSTEPGQGNPTNVPAGQITLGEAIELAGKHAPHYYAGTEADRFGRVGRLPANAVQERFVADWQEWAGTGQLPHETLVREWARHTGSTDLLDRARFSDDAERADALERHWVDGTDQRDVGEYELHRERMAAGGLDPDDFGGRDHVTDTDRENYHRYLDTDVFMSSDPGQVARAWQDASRDVMLHPDDTVAIAARDNLAAKINTRWGMDPATYLADAVHDAQVSAADARRQVDHAAAIAAWESSAGIADETHMGPLVEYQELAGMEPAAQVELGVTGTSETARQERMYRAQRIMDEFDYGHTTARESAAAEGRSMEAVQAQWPLPIAAGLVLEHRGDAAAAAADDRYASVAQIAEASLTETATGVTADRAPNPNDGERRDAPTIGMPVAAGQHAQQVPDSPQPELETGPARETAAEGDVAAEQVAVEAQQAPVERGVAPSKASTPQERDHRAQSWRAAEAEFRAGLDPSLTPAQAGQAWRDLPTGERYERSWAAYDAPEQQSSRQAGDVASSAGPAGAANNESQQQQRATPAAAADAAPQEVSRERVLELNNAAADWFAGNLTPDSAGYEYLSGRLGQDAITSGQWRLGYVAGEWNGLTNHLKRTEGATDAEIRAAGLGRESSIGTTIDAFRNRAMAAVSDTDGSVVGFYGRDLSGDERAPKHLNTGATPAYTKGEHVFGLYEAPTGARLVRTEATFDAIAMTQATDGQLHGVAPLGTALTDTQADKLAARAQQSEGGRIWVALDNDAGGQRQLEKDYWAFASRGLDVREVGLPRGTDPSQMWQDNPDTLRAIASVPDVLPSAAMTLMDNTVDAERTGLLIGDPDARDRVDMTQQELDQTLRSDVDRHMLGQHVDSRVQELRNQESQERAEAVGYDTRERGQEQRADQANSPQERERLEDLADQDREREQQARGDAQTLRGQQQSAQLDEQRRAAQDEQPDVELPYNRAAESDLGNVSPAAARARAVSAHGFSESTQSGLDRGKAAGGKWQPKRPTPGQGQQVGRTKGMRR